MPTQSWDVSPRHLRLINGLGKTMMGINRTVRSAFRLMQPRCNPQRFLRLPTERRVERRNYSNYTFPDDDTLYSWSKDVGLTVGNEIFRDPIWHRKILRLWKDVGASSVSDTDVTDLSILGSKGNRFLMLAKPTKD
jgi:hypothetical protein